MKELYATFPRGSYLPIKIEVKLMKAEKTCVIGNIEIYSIEAIYTRIILSHEYIKYKNRRCAEVQIVTCSNVSL